MSDDNDDNNDDNEDDDDDNDDEDIFCVSLLLSAHFRGSVVSCLKDFLLV